MVDLVECRRQVGVKNPPAPGPADGVDHLDRVMATAARPEPVRSGREPGLPLGLQRVAAARLVAAVHQHGNSERPQLRRI